MSRVRQSMVANLSVLWQTTRRRLARWASSLFELPSEATGARCVSRLETRAFLIWFGERFFATCRRESSICRRPGFRPCVYAIQRSPWWRTVSMQGPQCKRQGFPGERDPRSDPGRPRSLEVAGLEPLTEGHARYNRANESRGRRIVGHTQAPNNEMCSRRSSAFRFRLAKQATAEAAAQGNHSNGEWD